MTIKSWLSSQGHHPGPTSQSSSKKSLGITSAEDWIGPSDPEDPHNWSSGKKLFQAAAVSGIALVTTLNISVFSPSISLVQEDFSVDVEAVRAAYVMYIFGLALSSPFVSPLSETYGRRIVYVVCMPLFACFVLGAGFVQNIVGLIFLRLLAGLCAGPGLSLGSASIADMLTPEQRSTPMSIYVAMVFLGPSLGPVLGSFAAYEMGWQWSSWIILFVCAAIFPSFFFFEETYKRTILERRAKRLDIPGPAKPARQSTFAFLRTALVRPLHMLVTEPIVAVWCLYVGFNFALQYAFFSSFGWVYSTYYGFTETQTSLTFLAFVVGFASSLGLTTLFNRAYYLPLAHRTKKNGEIAAGATSKLAPEQRLPLALIGAPMITFSLIFFAWTASFQVHWIAPVIAGAGFAAGNMLTFMACSLYLFDSYGPLYGASAMAANATMRFLGGTIFPLFTTQFFAALGVGWAATTFGLLSLVGLVLALTLWFRGPQIRAKSTYSRGD